MQKKLVAMLAAISLMALPSLAAAAANLVTVAKTGGNFSSPIAAIASITNASATNRYLVKINPGTYNLGTSALVMKQFVDVEGSGEDNTIITSSRTNVNFDTCTVGTVEMANDSSLRRLKVVNTAPDAGSDNLTAGIVFNNVKASIEDVKVVVGTDTAYGARNAGICSSGTDAVANVSEVDVETRSYGGHSNAAMIMWDSSMTITSSKLASFSDGPSTSGTGSYIHTVDCVDSNAQGTLTISASTITATCMSADCGSNAVFSDCSTTTIRDSIIRTIGSRDGDGVFWSSGDMNILNNQVFSNPAKSIVEGWETPKKLANNLLQGYFTNLPLHVKSLNNYNENLIPYPNQY